MSQITDLIPHRPPFLFVDEIVSGSPDSLIARRTFRADEEFFKSLVNSASTPFTVPMKLRHDDARPPNAVTVSRSALSSVTTRTSP